MNDDFYKKGHMPSEERYKMALERQQKRSTPKDTTAEGKRRYKATANRYAKRKIRYKRKNYFSKVGIASLCAVLCLAVVYKLCQNTGANVDVSKNIEYITISSTASSKIDTKTQSSEVAPKTQNEAVSSQPVQNNEVLEYNKHCDWTMYLVNGDYPLTEDYKITTKLLQGYEVDTRIYQCLEDMINSALNDGVRLKISSAYRTYEYQQDLFNNEIASYTDKGFSYQEAYNLAKRSVAVPNSSEHQIGLAVDLNDVSEDFKYTSAYRWLCENAQDYGFIERYPDGKSDITKIIYEPWHYRYVGIENAKAIKASGLCLEEYITQVEIPQMKTGG